MASWAWLIFSLILVQKGTAFQRPDIVNRIPSERARDSILERTLDELAKDDWLRSDRYLYNHVDLNGDGQAELLVQIREGGYCTSYGCPMRSADGRVGSVVW